MSNLQILILLSSSANKYKAQLAKMQFFQNRLSVEYCDFDKRDEKLEKNQEHFGLFS